MSICDEVFKNIHVIFSSVNVGAQSGMGVEHQHFEHSNQRVLTLILKVVLKNDQNIFTQN
jgi:hypothetical protein